MRFFVGSNLNDLDKQGVFKEQDFRVVAVHSDNAFQVATSNHEMSFSLQSLYFLFLYLIA